MGISRWTALIIQNEENDIRCEVYGQRTEGGKWAGAVNQYKAGRHHTTLLSSQPTFDSSEKAVLAMEEVVEKIRGMDVLT